MDTNQYLTNIIQDNSSYTLTAEDKKVIQHEGVETFIFNKLDSSRFKASATEKGYLQKIKDKIHLSIMHDEPIYITLPFGATKNPYLPTAPAIDWAEVFNIAFIREYLKPIAAAYKNGVILEYVSVAVFEEKVNRIPKKDTDLYDKEFQKLIEYYQKFLPENFKLRYFRVEDSIPRSQIEKLIGIKMEELRKTWNKQTPEVIEYKLIRAKRNSIYNPNDSHFDSLILNSALGHDAFCSECWTTDAAPWDKKNMITLAHNYTTGWAIHVRSTPGSSVNFWSGIGVLLDRNGKYIPTVLSPKQYQEQKQEIKEVKVNIFGESFANLNTLLIVK